jgi:hypothetical protein
MYPSSQATTAAPSIQALGLDPQGPVQVYFEKVTGADWGPFFESVDFWWTVYSIVAIIFSLFCIAGFIYGKTKYNELSEKEQESLREIEKAWALRHEQPKAKNARWEVIQQRVAEHSPESWRVAILEADILLEETLINAGYPGHTLGEKLKSANPQSFTTIQDAWSAHKVRNEIAHVGSDFILTQKTAKETIIQFERVFREFGVI